jgi:hypothetical protein
MLKPKRLAAIFAALFILTAAMYPPAIAEDGEDISTIASVPSMREEVFVGTAFEDTDAYWFVRTMRSRVFVNSPGASAPASVFLAISSWDTLAYNPDVPGVYTLYGEIDLSSFAGGILENPDNIRAEIIMTVLEQRVPVIDEENIQRESWREDGARHWSDTLAFTVDGLNPWLGWEITVWQSNDEGETWFDISGSDALKIAADGFTVSGLEEGRDYGFKVEVNGDGILQGVSGSVFVTLDESDTYGFLVGGDRTGKRPGGDDDLPPIEPTPAPPPRPRRQPTRQPPPAPSPSPAPLPEPTPAPTPAPSPSYVPSPEPTPGDTVYAAENDGNAEDCAEPIPNEIHTPPAPEEPAETDCGQSVTFTQYETSVSIPASYLEEPGLNDADSLTVTFPNPNNTDAGTILAANDILVNPPHIAALSIISDPEAIKNSWMPVFITGGISLIIAAAFYFFRRKQAVK